LSALFHFFNGKHLEFSHLQITPFKIRRFWRKKAVPVENILNFLFAFPSNSGIVALVRRSRASRLVL